jgi:hypothetical protein
MSPLASGVWMCLRMEATMSQMGKALWMGMERMRALALTSPTLTPPLWVKRIVTFMHSIDADIIFHVQRVREEGWMMKLSRLLVIDSTCGISNCQVRSSIIKDVIRVLHGYRFTCSFWATGHAGMGTVSEFSTCMDTVPATATVVLWVFAGICTCCATPLNQITEWQLSELYRDGVQ